MDQRFLEKEEHFILTLRRETAKWEHEAARIRLHAAQEELDFIMRKRDQWERSTRPVRVSE